MGKINHVIRRVIWEDIDKLRHRIIRIQGELEKEKQEYINNEKRHTEDLVLALDELCRLVEDLEQEE